MTTNGQKRGKYDDGTCFICSLEGTKDEPLVESRWKLYRIWLCQHHVDVVRSRMKERGQTRDQVLEGLMDSMIEGLGMFGALGLGGGSGRTQPRSADEAEEIAAAERLDQEDLEDMEYAYKKATYRTCKVCGNFEDTWESVAEYEVNGSTVVLCPRDEKSVLGLIDEGMELDAAIHRVGVDLFQQLLNPDHEEELRRIRAELEEKNSERGSNDDRRGQG